MKFTLAIMAVSAISSPVVLATNFIIIQPDDMEFYENWSPPAHLPWGNNYPGAEYPLNSNLPWINKLRNDGMSNLNAYAASPKCGTSRYSTVTGRYASRSSSARRASFRNGVQPVSATIPNTKLQDQNRVQDGDDCSHSNIAQVFSKNSYVTGMVGKWHLSDTNNRLTSEVKQEIVSCGFQDVEAMYPDNIGNQNWANGIHHNMEYVAYKAVEFIQANQDNDWFLYVNPTVPHGPDVEVAMDVDCRITTDGDFTNLLTTGWSVDGMTKDFGDDCDLYRADVKARAGANTNANLGSIWVDDAIGAIYKALNNTNQLDDTVILFQLDHGKVEKDKIWEGGVRIPQFVHWPNGNLPATFDGPVSTIDIGPTMLDIAGILDNPAANSMYNMDGKSWLDAVNGEADDFNNRCIFFESDDDRAVKCGCDKYMLLSSDSRELTEAASNSWSGWQSGQTEALFNLCDENGEYISAADSPDNVSPESVNLVAQEPAKVSDLSTLMDCHLAKTDARNANVNIPQYHECTGSIATSNPTTRPTVSPTTSTASPTLPVAEIGGKPLVVDYSPWENDIEASSSTFVLSASVLDDNLTRVRFNLRLPDGTTQPGGFKRGSLMSSSGDKHTYEAEVDTSTQIGKYSFWLNIVDGDGNNFNYPEDGSEIEFVVASNAADVVTGARAEIRRIINNAFSNDPLLDVNLAAKFVRMGFHDCVGGCDGCVDMTNPDNAGLDVPITALQPIVERFEHLGVTRADIWVLAALEGAGGQQPNGPNDDTPRDFDMEWFGRPTCDDLDPLNCVDGDCSQSRGPHRDLPSPDLHTGELVQFFADNFDFDERDTVAIMGAHTLGGLSRENSGFNGVNGWLGNTRTFGNGYYTNLVGGTNASSPVEELIQASNWNQVHIPNSADGFSTPDRHEWERGNNPDHFVMVNSDIALVRDLGGGLLNTVTGEASCQFRCRRNCVPMQCPHAAATIAIVAEYKFDNGAFLEDFEDAFKRMLNKGFDDSGGCLVVDQPCAIPTISRKNLRG